MSSPSFLVFALCSCGLICNCCASRLGVDAYVTAPRIAQVIQGKQARRKTQLQTAQVFPNDGALLQHAEHNSRQQRKGRPQKTEPPMLPTAAKNNGLQNYNQIAEVTGPLTRSKAKRSLSLVVYNVMWEVTADEDIRNAKKIPERARENVVKYLTKDEKDTDFLVILEVTTQLLEDLCPRKESRPADFTDTGAVFGQMGNSQCAYIFDQSGQEGIAILYKPHKYKLIRRSCLQGKHVGKARPEVHKDEAALVPEDCVNLPGGEDGVDFTHTYRKPSKKGKMKTKTDHRTLLLGAFKEKSSGRTVTIAAMHPGHIFHHKDLPRLNDALRLFYREAPEADSDLAILAGDFNTGGPGIHSSAKAQEAEAKSKFRAKSARKSSKQLYKAANTYVREKTWFLNSYQDLDKRFPNNTINNVLKPWFDDNGYEDLRDAAFLNENVQSSRYGQGNLASYLGYKDPAKADEKTCCCEFERGYGEAFLAKAARLLGVTYKDCHLKKAFDHILFTQKKGAPVAGQYWVTVGQADFPSSDHVPLKMVLQWLEDTYVS